MKITLTGINFTYANGYNADYTGVNLSFATSGETFNISGYVAVTKDEYTAAAGDVSKLTDLIKSKVQEKIAEKPETTEQAAG
ncbi:hypothetical protein [Weizmannia acidilactici]|uniref:hypothetical protein n=1 Tax=Weizmannia acidilactici TaxID=2607726 RepID=UPI00124D91D6|nr:hypothetical protein [Weizmannia acidilactici]GER73445.1 hypothetical protein BpPP18_15120 [Weizmannia acidilactici]